MSRPENWRRNIEVITLFLIGMPQAEIARLCGVSRQRIGQIVRKGAYG